MAGDRRAVDYDEVFRLSEFIGREGRGAEQFAAIRQALRNHALDGIGIGVFGALRPVEATRVGGA